MPAFTSSLDIINELIDTYCDKDNSIGNHAHTELHQMRRISTISTNQSEQKRIFLWSTRRVLSMAFHRAIYQLDGIKHFCEPFCLPFYFGSERKSVQFVDQQHLAQKFTPCPTYAQSLNNITKQYPSKYHTVFIKEHAIHVWPDVIPQQILSASINTFIIRNPAKAIPSLYRQTLASFDDSLWDHVVTEEIGFKELYLMYDFVVHTLHQPTIIIDADDLLQCPQQILIKYCAFVGLEYSDCMLDWTDDYKRKEDAPWDFVSPSWISDVKTTTGFRKKDKKHHPNIKYPKYISDAIQEALPFYEKLRMERIRL
eukprot:318456_1